MDKNKHRKQHSDSDIYINLQVQYLGLLTSHLTPLHFSVSKEFLISIHIVSTFSQGFSEYVPYKYGYQVLGLTWIHFPPPWCSSAFCSRDNMPGISWQREAQAEQQLLPRHSQHWQVVPQRPVDVQATKHTQLGYMGRVQQDQWIQALPAFCQHLSHYVRMNMKNSCFLRCCNLKA